MTGASCRDRTCHCARFAEAGARGRLTGARADKDWPPPSEDVERAGGHALPIPTDVSDFDQVDAAAEGVET